MSDSNVPCFDCDDSLSTSLDEYLHEVIDKISSETSPSKLNMSLQSLKTVVLLKVLEWYGARWSQLRDLTTQTVYVQPEIATRLSELIACSSGEESSLHQLFVRPERLGRALSSTINKKCSSSRNRAFTFCLDHGGSAADEMDAILAVDGLAASTIPNFDVKRYVDNCRFPLPTLSSNSGSSPLVERRDVMFEQDTLDDDDKRVHVFAVRDLYAHVPFKQLLHKNERSGCEIVYSAIREAFKKVSGDDVLPPLPDVTNADDAPTDMVDLGSSSSNDEEVAESTTAAVVEEGLAQHVVPHLADRYLAIVQVDRVKRLVKRLVDDKKTEQRGRKRKALSEEGSCKKNCSTKPRKSKTTQS